MSNSDDTSRDSEHQARIRRLFGLGGWQVGNRDISRRVYSEAFVDGNALLLGRSAAESAEEIASMGRSIGLRDYAEKLP